MIRTMAAALALYLCITAATCPGDSWQTILAAPADGSSGGDAGNLNPGGGPPAVYTGVHEKEVRHLLARSPYWRTPKDAQDEGVLPSYSVGRLCQWDTYVAGALLAAWAAEGLYRHQYWKEAAEHAIAAKQNLDEANTHCSNIVVHENPLMNGCSMTDFWSCPPPF